MNIPEIKEVRKIFWDGASCAMLPRRKTGLNQLILGDENFVLLNKLIHKSEALPKDVNVVSVTNPYGTLIFELSMDPSKLFPDMSAYEIDVRLGGYRKNMYNAFELKGSVDEAVRFTQDGQLFIPEDNATNFMRTYIRKSVEAPQSPTSQEDPQASNIRARGRLVGKEGAKKLGFAS